MEGTEPSILEFKWSASTHQPQLTLAHTSSHHTWEHPMISSKRCCEIHTHIIPHSHRVDPILNISYKPLSLHSLAPLSPNPRSIFLS